MFARQGGNILGSDLKPFGVTSSDLRVKGMLEDYNKSWASSFSNSWSTSGPISSGPAVASFLNFLIVFVL
jgi:hypothetical protein